MIARPDVSLPGAPADPLTKRSKAVNDRLAVADVVPKSALVRDAADCQSVRIVLVEGGTVATELGRGLAEHRVAHRLGEAAFPAVCWHGEKLAQRADSSGE